MLLGKKFWYKLGVIGNQCQLYVIQCGFDLRLNRLRIRGLMTYK